MATSLSIFSGARRMETPSTRSTGRMSPFDSASSQSMPPDCPFLENLWAKASYSFWSLSGSGLAWQRRQVGDSSTSRPAEQEAKTGFPPTTVLPLWQAPQW